MSVHTRIPPRMLRAVLNTPEPVRPVRPPQRQRPVKAFKPPAKRPVRAAGPVLPLDQRVVSVPLWWLRWFLLKAAWVLDWPSIAVYWLAMRVNWVGANYGKIRSFAIAHAVGPVSRRTWRKRAKACKGCKHHYRAADKQRYCKGDSAGRGCGCGHWRLARLVNKLGLSGWRCPTGQFDYGLLGRFIRGAITWLSRRG